METGDTKVVTFQNHYGAMMLKKKMGNCCTLRAVPRSLSSSCGTCIFVTGADLDTILDNAEKDLLEGIYRVVDNGYESIWVKQ